MSQVLGLLAMSDLLKQMVKSRLSVRFLCIPSRACPPKDIIASFALLVNDPRQICLTLVMGGGIISVVGSLMAQLHCTRYSLLPRLRAICCLLCRGPFCDASPLS